MSYTMTKELEEKIVELVNSRIKDPISIEMDDYNVLSFSVSTEVILYEIIKTLKLKDLGPITKFPKVLPQQVEYTGYQIIADPDRYKRLATSKKFNCVLLYTVDKYDISCDIICDVDYTEKIIKKIRKLTLSDDAKMIFNSEDLKCDPDGEYIEICKSDDDKKEVKTVKKTLTKENLVFEEGSTITGVISDIKTFFTDETQKLYSKLDIPYKRGIILYGDPGNGKSSMIREIIRTTPNVLKVVVNSNAGYIPKILSALLKHLNGENCIIVMEDFDAIIDNSNRSELLNILDGVDIKSGVFFIGTTNYYDRIDPAFMNRSGRFDRSYKIDNPSEQTRRLYFESRNIDILLSEHPVYSESEEDTSKSVIDLFTEYSHDMPMANLKELITSVSYLLASNSNKTIKDAIVEVSNIISGNRESHIKSHENYECKKNKPLARRARY